MNTINYMMKRFEIALILLIVFFSFPFAGFYREHVPVLFHQTSEAASVYVRPVPLVTTAIPSRLVTIIPSPQPFMKMSVTPLSPAVSNQHEIMTTIEEHIFNQVNNFRRSNGLPILDVNRTVCRFAHARAEEITGNFTHDGFQNRIKNNSLPYGTYSLVVENLAVESNSLSVVSRWITSIGHEKNMLQNIRFGCIGENGAYYAFEGYTP